MDAAVLTVKSCVFIILYSPSLTTHNGLPKPVSRSCVEPK